MIIREYSKGNNFEVYIHDDSKLFLTLKEQLSKFQDAASIIAPHGAGEVLNAAARVGTCTIEFLDIWK